MEIYAKKSSPENHFPGAALKLFKRIREGQFEVCGEGTVLDIGLPGFTPVWLTCHDDDFVVLLRHPKFIDEVVVPDFIVGGFGNLNLVFQSELEAKNLCAVFIVGVNYLKNSDKWSPSDAAEMRLAEQFVFPSLWQNIFNFYSELQHGKFLKLFDMPGHSGANAYQAPSKDLLNLFKMALDN